MNLSKYKTRFSDIEAPKVLPPPVKLRNVILRFLEQQKGSSNWITLYENVESVLNKYDLNGFVLYSELMDMIWEGILKINNDELNKDSIISIKSS